MISPIDSQDKQPIILIVDDNQVNRTILRDLITVIGHKPEEAVNGEEALTRIFRKPHPDMILLDIMMPGIDGYDVLDKVKADKFLRLLPVIMITAVDDVESQIRCIEKGADDYIIKPFNSVLLRSRIDALLEKKRLYEQEQKFNLWLAESYQQLQKAENARDSLLQMILHDLNNPLMVIKGHAQLLAKEAEQGDPIDEIVKRTEIIENAADQMQDLTRQILDVTGLENHTLNVTLESVELMKVIEDVVSVFRIDIHEAGGSINVEGDPELKVNADKKLLMRLLQNVVVNSIKYATEEALRIDIVVGSDDATGRVEVQDNGRGIAPKYQKEVFGKFFRIPSKNPEKTKGLGMGLAFCKAAIDAMSGDIKLHSSGRGGTRVTVKLPRS